MHPNKNRDHPPAWFKEASLGIFIHWGLPSVPAFAPVEGPDYAEIVRTRPPHEWFKHFPYAEWYLNSLRIAESPVQKHHHQHFGNASYEAFADTFKTSAKAVDVDHWARLFRRTGADYVVMVTKHHDGFVMYDSAVSHPHLAAYHLDFDFVGDLAKAVRAEGMRFGVYYSSLLDWTFTKKAVTSASTMYLENDQSRTYRDYCYRHWLELIERYSPDILWNDIGYPDKRSLLDIFDVYYRTVPQGVVNDRWTIFPKRLRNPLGKWLLDREARKILTGNNKADQDAMYYDYRTIEYETAWERKSVLFEMCRGLDKSFAYNRYSRPQDFITAEDIEGFLAEIRPKGGRLLLGVGPDMDGSIPALQRQILEDVARRKEARDRLPI